MKRKNLSLIIIGVLFAFFSCHRGSQPQSFTLKGKLSGIEKARKLTISYRDSAYNRINDTLYLTTDTFTYTRKWQAPTIVSVSSNTKDNLWLMLMQPETVAITGKVDSLAKAQTSDYQGKKDFDTFKEMVKMIEIAQLKSLQENLKNGSEEKLIRKNDSLYEWQRGEIAKEFIKTHPNSLTSVYLAAIYLTNGEAEDLQNYLDAMSETQQNSKYGMYFKDVLGTLKTIQIGKKAPNFTQNDVNGKPISLASYRGKYVLVDFWASWCGPCRKENPTVVKAYQKYHPKGLEIIGVSLDKNSSDWKEAIEKDQLKWQHVSDLKHWQNAVARLYSVRSVPANFLLDPQGIIIARNLRGEELTAELAKIFP